MRVFKKQEEALSERKENEFTFAVNYENSKACFFVNATEEDFWNKYMAVGPRNNYEKILANKPCHLFLDLDMNTSKYPNTNIETVWETIKKLILDAFNFFDIPSQDVRFIVLHSHSETKQSLHIIVKIKNKLFHNLIHCGSFMEEIKESVDENIRDIIDTTIYTKNRNFRMLGCTKAGQERYLVGDKPLSYEFWKDCKIQPLEWKGDTIELEIKEVKQHYFSSYVPPVVLNFMSSLNDNKQFVKMSGRLDLCRIHAFPSSLVFVCNTVSKRCPFVCRRHSTNVTYVVVDLLRRVYYLKCRSTKHCKGKKTKEFKMKDILGIRNIC